MAGVLGITVNTTTEPSQLFAGEERILKNVTIKAGEGAALARGTVLAIGTDGKYYVLDLEAAVTAEVLMAGTGAVKTLANCAASGKLVPGTVTIKSTVGAAQKTITDDGFGRLADAQHKGIVDYESGWIEMAFTAAPDNSTNVTVDYYKRGATGVASAVAANSEAVDCTADKVIPAVMLAGVRSADLVWPDSITDPQKARAIQQLRAAGIIVI